jgi:hypothetical protein
MDTLETYQVPAVGRVPRRGFPITDEEDDDDDYHVIKEEADQAMEDATPPGAGDLPPEYQAVVVAGYDEEALLQQVLDASKADEDKIFLGYSDTIALTSMVTEHLALLPPPPPLLPHAPLLATYEGREVPPAFCTTSVAMITRTEWSSTRRRRPNRRSSSTSSPTMRSSLRLHSRCP